MNKLTIFILLILMSACNSTSFSEDPLEHFEDTQLVNLKVSKKINLEEYGIYKPGEIIEKHGMYIIKDNSDSCLVKALDISRNRVYRGIFKGNGPNEIISMSSLQLCDSDVLIYDIMRKKINRLLFNEIDTTINMINYRTLFGKERPFIVSCVGERTVASGYFQTSWINYYDDKLNSSLSFPNFSNEGLSNEEKSVVYMSTLITTKPDRSKIACATQKAGVVSISDCSGDTLKELVRLCYFPAKVQPNKSSLVTFSKDGKIGFCDIDCDNSYIYLLYSGRVRGEAGMMANHCQHVLIYDWNGKPVKHIQLEKPLFSMGYNVSLNKIYGIGYDPEGCILEYDLNEK